MAAYPSMTPRPVILMTPEDRAKFQVAQLNVCYGERHALRHVTLNVPERQITAFIGPAGSGKSTLLRCMNRTYDQLPGMRVTGTLLLDGQSVLADDVDPVALRQRVGMIPQHPTPFPLSVYDNVAYGPRRHGLRQRAQLDQLVEEALRRAALWDEVKDQLRRRATSLSASQQQRLCIARALAVQPEVLLLDEPCAALDPLATFKVEELLRTLREQATVVIVTHDLYQASRVADYTGFFMRGELIEFGPTDGIFERPVDQRTDNYVCGRLG